MLVEALRVAGAVHLAIAAGNLLVPRLLDYRRHLPGLDPHIRQVHHVHAVFIIVVLVMFGLICLLFPDDLRSTPLGRFLSGCLCLFWLLRAVLTVCYYDRGWQLRHWPLTLPFAICVLAFVAVFALAALG